jgi:hypothetical protein
MANKSGESILRATAPAPELFNEFQAAAYISMSAAYLRVRRSRGCVGASTPGPPYLKLGWKIRYRRDDLDAWLMERRVDRGTKKPRSAATAPPPAA